MLTSLWQGVSVKFLLTTHIQSYQISLPNSSHSGLRLISQAFFASGCVYSLSLALSLSLSLSLFFSLSRSSSLPISLSNWTKMPVQICRASLRSSSHAVGQCNWLWQGYRKLHHVKKWQHTLWHLLRRWPEISSIPRRPSVPSVGLPCLFFPRCPQCCGLPDAFSPPR